LASCWQRISPQLLLAELTAPNTYEEFARQSGHLTPSLLAQELVSFRELKGYLPQVVLVHINPELEKEIASEIAAVAKDLEHPITLGYEGMRLHL
jgi:phosphoribosyl 1,2-cyclic phosphodiesterase